MKVFLVALVLLSFGARANDCVELGKCVESVSKLTGKKYLYDNRVIKGGLQSSSNVEITAENADTLFTYILDMNGYARVPTAVKDTYMIVESRDIRYQRLPTINVDAQTAPTIPQNYDYYLMNYKFKHFNQGQLRMTANSLRPFMSRYSRVIELKGNGMLVLQENASKLLQAYEMIKLNDRELSKEEVLAMKEEERKQELREKSESKQDKQDKKDKKAEKKKD